MIFSWQGASRSPLQLVYEVFGVIISLRDLAHWWKWYCFAYMCLYVKGFIQALRVTTSADSAVADEDDNANDDEDLEPTHRRKKKKQEITVCRSYHYKIGEYIASTIYLLHKVPQ